MSLLSCAGPLVRGYRRTAWYLQSEASDDLVIMQESYLQVLTLYFSLIGVLAAEEALGARPGELPVCGVC